MIVLELNKTKTIKTNAVSNAMLYPDHWSISPKIYIKIAFMLKKESPLWFEYYKDELDFIPETEEALNLIRNT